MNLQHQCELQNINIVDGSKLKIIERSVIPDAVVVRGRLGAKLSAIEVSFADGCRDGQTCKAEKGEQFDKAGMHFRSWLADLFVWTTNVEELTVKNELKCLLDRMLPDFVSSRSQQGGHYRSKRKNE